MTASNFAWRRGAAALLLGSAMFAFAPTAAADPTPQEKEHARELMADGRDKRDRNDLAGAVEAFKQADAIMHVPTTAYEVAKTQQQMGKLVDARETVDAISRLPASANDPAPFNEARGKADVLGRELDKQLARIRVDAAAAATAGSVTVDGAPATPHDGVIWVMPGKHTVVAGSASAEVTVAAGETKTVEVQGTPKPYGAEQPPPPTTGGGLKIPTLSLIGFGVGAAGLVVGSITGVMAMSAEGDLSDECPNMKCRSDRRDDLDSAKTKATISTVGFIVAGVGIAVGVVGFFLQPKTEAKVGAVKLDFARMRATF